MAVSLPALRVLGRCGGDGPDGHAVASIAASLKEPPKIVYTTGLPLTDGLKAMLVKGSVYVQKPYDASALVAAVSDALNQP
jgi:hypothetical protein